MARSRLEQEFIFHARLYGIAGYQEEQRFHPKRRWRFDFAWPDRKVAVEVEGGTWTGGRHTRGQGFANDCDKYNEAARLGWVVVRGTTSHVTDPDWYGLIKDVLKSRPGAGQGAEDPAGCSAQGSCESCSGDCK